MYGIIYKIKNKINGKLYIGQTIMPLEKRWAFHKSTNSGCRLLRSAIQKYGKENFEITIIARCNSPAEMDQREIFCIRIFNTIANYGYNLSAGGNAHIRSEEFIKKHKEAMSRPEVRKKISESKKGKKASEETKRKLSLLRKGKKHSPERIEKARLGLVGKPKSESHKKSLSIVRTGTKQTKETKNKISNWLKEHHPMRGKYHSEFSKNLMSKSAKKPIVCNETGKIYEGSTDAALEFGVSKHYIYRVLKGKARSCKGFTFRYYINKKNS